MLRGYPQGIEPTNKCSKELYNRKGHIMLQRIIVMAGLTILGFTTACFAQTSSPDTESTAALERLPETLEADTTTDSKTPDVRAVSPTALRAC